MPARVRNMTAVERQAPSLRLHIARQRKFMARLQRRNALQTEVDAAKEAEAVAIMEFENATFEMIRADEEQERQQNQQAREVITLEHDVAIKEEEHTETAQPVGQASNNASTRIEENAQQVGQDINNEVTHAEKSAQPVGQPEPDSLNRTANRATLLAW